MHSSHTHSQSQSVPPTNSSTSGGVNRETLKSLQDVYWSDDEDDPDCLLCAEPLDLSDLNFKPCQCGLQICQFCYNKLLSTDARCPGCRRPYDAKAVVFQPVDWEEVKRAKERKTKRAKVIKQLTQMGRRNLLGVRIVMKNMVHVVGMKLPAPGDEAIPILRSNDYFGQYGKISKLYLCDRTKLSSTAVSTLTPDNPATSTGIYIVYIRREDAARAITALDGIPAPQGPPGAVLKATYGTTRYCDAFLRGAKCDNNACHNLHEWGGESDCFTKEDFETALTRPAEYDARQKQTVAPPPLLSSKTAWPKPSSEDVNGSSSGLPSAASWGKNITVKTRAPAASAIARPTKIGGNLVPLGKNNAAFPLPSPAPTIPIIIKEKKEKRSAALARTKSTDSTQSGNTTSAHTSPKKKPITLPMTPASTSTSTPDVVSSNTKPASTTTAPPPPPPGLSATPQSVAALPSASSAAPSDPPAPSAPSPPARASAPVPESIDDSPDERFSADSDAGPSSSSPAPQTPARSTDDIPPAPLSSEPILIHSPYPEPVIFSFPAHDKDFAFVLGLDEKELQRRQEQAEGYEPSPFSKTLEELAELGVHAPELPDLFADSPVPSGYHGLFRPFDLVDEVSPSTTDSTPGPSRSRDDHNAQRTESRFGFARPSSASTGTGVRGQSPFSHLRRSIAEPPVNLRDGWYTRQQMSDEPLQQQQQQQHQQHHLPQHQHQQNNDPRTAALAAQVASFVGSYDSSAATDGGTWAGGESIYSASPSHGRQLGLQQQQYGERGNAGGNERRLDHGLLQGGGFMQKALRSDRDEYDPPVLQYGSTQIYGNSAQSQGQSQPPQGQGRGGLFSPESASHSIHEDASYQQSPMAFNQLQAHGLQQHHHQQQQQQQQHHQPQHPDARTLMQLHHQRGQSPTPLVAQAYRRF
ncbi:CCR4-NOT transcription complex subunit 4 [Kwoniella heveanensis BCC8398]|uniref:CCR4-NOT transcription complex subunit 4 n=1 Tax=Kwoniella heveanensis BCC8398 TaxID=1296120 RepID=A0A1B9GZQ2_9TREE|nr:CCR4-NOT transcription complex subunit 4 [Kwoniella heveanensis BCC8398]